MSKKTVLKPVAVALGAAFVTSLAGTSIANAAENPFGMTELSSGYMVTEKAEGKCGEGKCGGEKKEAKEGKCGEGKCGGEKKEAKEGKCGEGKCGEGKMKKEGEGMDKSKKEGKCGEGKCGGAK